MSPTPDSLLSTYLNDHLAASTGGVELARRLSRAERQTGLGEFAERMAEAIEEDCVTLERILAAIGARRDPLKQPMARAGERLGRLKPNGRFVGRSPLSRLLELELLEVEVTGRRAMWLLLEAARDKRLAAFDPGALAGRAARQRGELEEQRIAAGTLAFAPPPRAQS